MTAKPSDLTQDLQLDLQNELEADLPARVEPVAVLPELPPELKDSTPVVSVHWTPLRWSRPRVVRAAKGAGKALKLGPLTAELSVKD